MFPNGIKKKPYECTVNAKIHSYTDTHGYIVLKAGTRVTCLDVVNYGNAVWLLIPSGYICAINDTGKIYVK